MQKRPPSQLTTSNPRVLIAVTLCLIGIFLSLLSLNANAHGKNIRGPVPEYTTPDNTVVTDGLVQTVVRSGDTIYIGGRFTRVGPRTGPGVEVAFDGSQNAGLPEVSGGAATIAAAVSDGAGGWYIAGSFTHVGGIVRNNIAHIGSDRTVDPAFNPNADGDIHALQISGSTIYVGGLFTSIGGQPRNRIAGLNAANGTATSFNPDANAPVEALAISDNGSIVYAGGRFVTIGGQSRVALAALNATDGSATTTFNPNPNNALVQALAISDSTLYVGGYFTAIGGQPRNNIAALTLGSPSDGAPTSFDPNATVGTCAACGGVSAIAVSHSGSTVYAGGLFKNIGGQVRNYLAALDATTGAPTSFNPNPNSNILGLAVASSDATVYVGGSFTTIGGQPRNKVAELNATDGSATAFNPNPNAVASAIGVSSSAIYLGGSFTSLGGVARRSVAAFSAVDGTVTAFDPNASFGANSGTVYALAVSGSTVYAGGFFNSIGGQPRNFIAELNAADGTATTWNPNASSTVETLVLADSLLYVGGDFSSIGGQPRNFIAAIGLPSDHATTFNPNANSSIAAIAVSGPLVYAGGFFTTIGGQTRHKIAALNASDGSATSWDPDATDSANVLCLAVLGSTIYAGGNFTSIHGQNRKNLAAISAVDGVPTDEFDPQANDGVYALAVSGSTVYAAGFFSMIGGQPRQLVAGLDAIDGSATSFDPSGSPGFGAFALNLAPDGKLYVGGSFRGFELAAQQGFAAFSNPSSAMLVSVVSSKTHGAAGTFDVELPITGSPGIECRGGIPDGAYTLVFTFANPLTSVGGASVTSGVGTVGSGTIGSDPHQYIVNLSGVANAQYITISLTDVMDSKGNVSSSVPASMDILIGDVNANGAVNASDVSEIKSQSGGTTTAGNFRTDLDANGTINASDTSLAKSKAGTVLP